MAAPVWSVTVELDIMVVVVFIFIMGIMVFDPTIIYSILHKHSVIHQSGKQILLSFDGTTDRRVDPSTVDRWPVVDTPDAGIQQF